MSDASRMGARRTDRDKPIVNDSMKLSYLIEKFPDWALDVFCNGCMHAGRLEPEKLIKRLGPAARLGDVKARLKCRKCQCVLSAMKPVFVGKRRD